MIDTVVNTVLILGIGLVGGLAAGRAGIPGGSLLGAMLAVGAFQLSSSVELAIAPEWGLLGQVLVGAVIGSTIDRGMLKSFRKVLLPAAFAVASTVVSGVLIGTAFALLGFGPPLSALFGLAPGGFAEMTAAAVALGASGPLVATMHLVRVIAVVVLLPFILRPVARWAVRRDAELAQRVAAGASDDA
jgi:membrane AbrB-like protein